ncbi:MAG: hypothetical protein ACYC2I_08860 [Elusimicrobiales bacterium]
MKPVLLAVLFLGLVAPSFSAVPDVDFDGTKGNAVNVAQELKTTVLEINTPDLPKEPPSGNISAEVAIKSSAGEWIVQQPEKIIDRISYYTFLPDTEVRTTLSCTMSNPDPNTDYWRVSVNHTNFPSNAGHINHPSVPPLQIPTGDPLPNPLTSRILPVNINYVYHWKVPSNTEVPPTSLSYLPAYATKISETAQFSYKCTGTLYMVTEMKVPNLKELTKGPGYDLVGASVTLHQKNHFGTEAMNTAVKKLATDYHSACSGAKSLSYNDMSLVWGGLYDIKGNWATPHKAHRFGVNLDVGKRQIKKSNRKKFIELACQAFNVLSEGDLSSEPFAHYHLTLKGAKSTGEELVTFDIDPRYTDCCPASTVSDKCIDLYDGGSLPTPPEEDTPSDCK